MFITKEIIRKKRDNHPISKDEIDFFIKGVLDNSVSSEQISAFAMAVFFNDLSTEERKNLTLAMRDSGEVIHFDNLKDKPIVDKHSTGGVGDLVSIPLAPIVAACGAYVPMITGKGLGHTGGTTDKMAAIPGYDVFPSVDKFKEVVQKVGCAIIGQTSNLAPADRRIYTIRDTTATVESIPMISSSILSKKLASGIKYLVMDVKTGNGAFMETFEKSKNLATTIVNIASSCSVPTKALITDMNESLARSIGNSLEIKESIEYLKGNIKSQKLHEIIVAFAANMLVIAGVENNIEKAEEKVVDSIKSGKALDVFKNMVIALGGPKDLVENYETILPKAPIVKQIYLKKPGYIKHIDSYALGMCLVHLGGGRKTATDVLDLSVGLDDVLQIGEYTDNTKPFCTIHCNNEKQVEEITAILNKIVETTENKADCMAIKTVYATI
jgi:thymidine phosphorylase